MLKLPDIEPGVILADPPIAFTTWSRKGKGRSPQRHYGCLTFEELNAIPIASRRPTSFSGRRRNDRSQ